MNKCLMPTLLLCTVLLLLAGLAPASSSTLALQPLQLDHTYYLPLIN